MLLPLALALLTDPSPAAQRVDLQRFSARLEQRLAAASRPAEPMVFISGLPDTRFVYIDGVGAVFLLPPRSLPARQPPVPNQPPPEVSVSAARPGIPLGPQVLVVTRPPDLTELEARIRETRKDAERMRAQAEAAFADAEKQLMADLRSAPPDAQAAVAMSSPWTFFLDDEVDDTRTPEDVEKDVRDALINTIVEDATLLRSLQSKDMITVSVDLVTRPQPWVRAKPARTLTVRAQKSDLDAYMGGKLTKDELLKRLQTKAY